MIKNKLKIKIFLILLLSLSTYNSQANFGNFFRTLADKVSASKNTSFSLSAAAGAISLWLYSGFSSNPEATVDLSVPVDTAVIATPLPEPAVVLPVSKGPGLEKNESNSNCKWLAATIMIGATAVAASGFWYYKKLMAMPIEDQNKFSFVPGARSGKELFTPVDSPNQSIPSVLESPESQVLDRSGTLGQHEVTACSLALAGVGSTDDTENGRLSREIVFTPQELEYNDSDIDIDDSDSEDRSVLGSPESQVLDRSGTLGQHEVTACSLALAGVGSTAVTKPDIGDGCDVIRAAAIFDYLTVKFDPLSRVKELNFGDEFDGGFLSEGSDSGGDDNSKELIDVEIKYTYSLGADDRGILNKIKVCKLDGLEEQEIIVDIFINQEGIKISEVKSIKMLSYTPDTRVAIVEINKSRLLVLN